MITFHGGPADGRTLLVHAAPNYLRVTRLPGRVRHAGEWDALDQPEDQPDDHEEIYVYRRASKASAIHIQLAPRRNSGFFAMAEYEYVDVDGEPFRDPALWRRFVAETPFPEPTVEPHVYRAAPR